MDDGKQNPRSSAGGAAENKAEKLAEAIAGMADASDHDDAALAEEGNLPPMKLNVAPPPSEGSLDFILDIPLRVSVELGRTKMLVQDLLKLHKGSVIELSKIAGEPLEVLLNDRVVARGEVIVVNEKFGVRLTDIVSHTQRIRNLGE